MNDGNVHEVIETKEAESAYESNSIFWVEVEKIVPNPYQPRKEFNEAKLNELAESIRMYGVLQPLVVTRKEVTLPNGAFRTEYELIAGERRLRASKLAGISQVPVLIRSNKETEMMKLELAIIENLQREDLNPVDRALAFNQLASQFGLNHTQIGKRMGRSRMYVANSIRLLGLPEVILNSLRNGELADGHARSLLMLKDRPDEQDVVYREAILKKLSVREVEHLCRQIATDKVRKKSWKDLEPELKEMERTFSESLGTKVRIDKTDYGGRVMIDYFSQDDLDQILRIVRGESNAEEEAQTEKAREQEVLETLAAATGVEPEAITQEDIHGEDIVAPQENDDAMEQEVDPMPEAAPFMQDSGEAMREDRAEESACVDTGSCAIEIDDPNDHAIAEAPDAQDLVTEEDMPETQLATESDMPSEDMVDETLMPETAIVEPAEHVVEEVQEENAPVAAPQDAPRAPEAEESRGYTDDGLYSLSNFSL